MKHEKNKDENLTILMRQRYKKHNSKGTNLNKFVSVPLKKKKKTFQAIQNIRSFIALRQQFSGVNLETDFCPTVRFGSKFSSLISPFYTRICLF